MPIGPVIVEGVATVVLWVIEIFWEYFLGSIGRWVLWLFTLGHYEVSKESWTAAVVGLIAILGLAALFVSLSR